MSFVASSFVLFLVLFFFLFYLTPGRFRWVIVLIGSYLFYSFEDPFFLIPLLISTIIDYTSAIAIERNRSNNKKYFFLAISLLTNISLLVYFKYTDFFTSMFNLSESMGYSPSSVGLYAIPIGISFYTFQTVSYTLDVFNGSRNAERHLGYFAVFVSFFPQLVAGPIEKSAKLIPQLKSFVNVKIKNIKVLDATSLIIWGLVKKVLIADRIGVVVDKVYESPSEFSSILLIFSGCLFMIQIYCDFSGYTLIARGVAKLFGIELSKNWNFPLFQTSFKSFWVNWHITLSIWFKDYIYLPLGGNKVPFLKWGLLTLFVFFISGFWHGANYTFIIWGVLNGMFLIVEKFFSKYLKVRKLKLFSWGLIFILTGLFFISFRATSLNQLLLIGNLILEFQFDFIHDYVKLDMWKFSHLVNVALIISFFSYEFFCYFNKMEFEKSILKNPEVQLFLVFLILILGEFQNKTFIYFQF